MMTNGSVVIRAGDLDSDRQLALETFVRFLNPQYDDARFDSLSRLKAEGRIDARTVRFDLRASGSEVYYASLLGELGIDDVVHLLPPISYRRALQEYLDADALLLLHGAWMKRQVPAKTYEYLRARRPILALTPSGGDTAALLRRTGGATVVALDDEDRIAAALPEFLRRVRNGTHPLPDITQVTSYARHLQAGELARTLSQVVRPEPMGPGAGGRTAAGLDVPAVEVSAPPCRLAAGNQATH